MKSDDFKLLRVAVPSTRRAGANSNQDFPLGTDRPRSRNTGRWPEIGLERKRNNRTPADFALYPNGVECFWIELLASGRLRKNNRSNAPLRAALYHP